MKKDKVNKLKDYKSNETKWKVDWNYHYHLTVVVIQQVIHQ
jgi:hypothetical protein